MVEGGPIRFGRYELFDALGQGATGDVHLARPAEPSPDLPPVLVVKRLHASLHEDERFIRRFEHEATIARAIDSKHVVKVFDAGRVGDTLYIAMEYIAGWPLNQVISDSARAGTKPSIQSIVEVVRGALRGLEDLHAARGPDGATLGIVHRDIAPKNLMLDEHGVVRVIDLGLGKSTQQGWKTATGILMGTPGYMSPEQVMGQPVDARADVFAMGVVLFELLTLESFIPRGSILEMVTASLNPPYRAPSSVRIGVPQGIDAIVLRALAADPDDRYATAAEFRAALEHVIPPREADVADSLIGQLIFDRDAKTRADVQRFDAGAEGPAESITVPHAPPTRPSSPKARAAPPPPGPRPPRNRTGLVVALAATTGLIGFFARDLVDRDATSTAASSGVDVNRPTVTARPVAPEPPPPAPPSEATGAKRRPTPAVRPAAVVDAAPPTPPPSPPATPRLESIEDRRAHVRALLERALRLDDEPLSADLAQHLRSRDVPPDTTRALERRLVERERAGAPAGE